MVIGFARPVLAGLACSVPYACSDRGRHGRRRPLSSWISAKPFIPSVETQSHTTIDLEFFVDVVQVDFDRALTDAQGLSDALITYAARLDRLCETYSVKNLERCLAEFPKLIESIELSAGEPALTTMKN